MFCTQGLAARVDRAEARLCAHAATLAPDPAADVAPCVIDVGGGKAIFAGPGSPMNKMIGCGFDGPVDVDELSLVEDRFADLGADLQAEVSTLADAGVHRVL